MNLIEEKLLLYDDLTPDEQAEVAQYVERHPEWAPLLAEARALHALLRAGQPSAPPDAADLADYAVGRMQGSHRTDAQNERYARVERALAADPVLNQQAHALIKALEQLAAESEDPVAHFERLTQRRLGGAEPSQPSTARVYAWQPLRLALAACVGLAVLYGAFAVAGSALQPERATLAALGALPNAYEGLHLRGDAPADRASDRYALALDALAEARTTTLGLFPRYDAAALDAVAAQLREVVDTSGSESWEGSEALYALGKIRLYQGQDDEATWALQAVVALDGPHASEARRLLDYLQHEE